MKPSQNSWAGPRLLVHLGVILLLKFAVLGLLWHLLVQPFRVEVDTSAMAQRLTQAAQPSNPKEQTYDRPHSR